MGVGAQGLVGAFPADARVLGDLCHAPRLRAAGTWPLGAAVRCGRTDRGVRLRAGRSSRRGRRWPPRPPAPAHRGRPRPCPAHPARGAQGRTLTGHVDDPRASSMNAEALRPGAVLRPAAQSQPVAHRAARLTCAAARSACRAQPGRGAACTCSARLLRSLPRHREAPDPTMTRPDPTLRDRSLAAPRVRFGGALGQRHELHRGHRDGDRLHLEVAVPRLRGAAARWRAQ